MASSGEITPPCGVPCLLRLTFGGLPGPSPGSIIDRLEPHPDQLQHAPVHDPLLHAGHQLLVGDGVEVRLQVRVVHFPPPLLEVLLDLLQRIVGRSAGTESERTIQEVRLEDRLHDQQHRHLHHAVPDRRDAQRAELAVGLGNVHALHRLRPVGPGLERLFDLAQEAR